MEDNIYCASCQKKDGYKDANGYAFCPNCKKLIPQMNKKEIKNKVNELIASGVAKIGTTP